MAADFEYAIMADLPEFAPVAGVHMRPISGELGQINHIVLDPGAVVPQHRHTNEQLGYIVSGLITMTIAGETIPFGPGTGYRIAGNVEHGGVAGPEGCVVIDVFAPPREDYREAAERARSGT